MRVDQLVPAFHRGDAIGDEAWELRSFFRAEGHQSDIYCLSRDRGLEAESKLFSEFPAPSASDVTILHFALPSPLSGALAGLPSKKAIIYHNITPSAFFESVNPEFARIARMGREELAALAAATDLSLADSEYNRLELAELGFRNTAVFPLFVDFAKYALPENALLRDLYRDDRTNILFVGRIAPNKKIENLVKTVFYYKKYISPLVRLIVVGKTNTFPTYFAAVSRMADEFYLKPGELRFIGHVPDEEMFALYRASDVFLSLSEHEGFCLPLVESMMFDLPVVALGAAAVPYTLGEAGILLREFRPDKTAEAVHLAAKDPALRAALIESGRQELRRLRDFPRETFLRNRLAALRRRK